MSQRYPYEIHAILQHRARVNAAVAHRQGSYPYDKAIDPYVKPLDPYAKAEARALDPYREGAARAFDPYANVIDPYSGAIDHTVDESSALDVDEAPTPDSTPSLPSIVVKAILTFGDPTSEGRLVEAVALPWFEIVELIGKDPRAIYEIDDRRWEEIIAGAYSREGFDDVVLTPRSGDFGRDVIATKTGLGSIRIYDQVKAFASHRTVRADDVRALLGVLSGFQNVSKGVITTTSDFAPGIATDPGIAPFLPHRLELRPRGTLLPWLENLAKKPR